MTDAQLARTLLEHLLAIRDQILTLARSANYQVDAKRLFDLNNQIERIKQDVDSLDEEPNP